MPLLENITEGLARAANAPGVVGDIEKKKAARKNLSDRELEFNTQQILGDVSALHERKSKLDPNSPTYAQDSAQIDKALHDAMGTFKDLYHPENNPGALSKVGAFIQSHLGKKKAAPTTPAEAKQSLQSRMEGIEGVAYAPQVQPNPYVVKKRQLSEAGVADDEALRIATGQKDTATKFMPQLQETTDPATGVKHYYRVPLEAGGKPEEVDFNGQVVTQKGVGAAPKVGSLGDFLTAAYGPRPTPEQIQEGKRLWAQAGAGTTVGEHVVMVPQKDGSIVPITIQTTSTKSFGAPAHPSPNVAKTPGEAKSKIAAVAPPHAAGVVAKGEAVGGRLTAPEAKAKTEYDEAVKLANIADDTLAHPSAAKDKSLALTIVRGAAGRVNMAEIDLLTKKYGIANTLEAWANSATTGELPIEIRKQLVGLTHTYLNGAKAGLDAASGGTNDDDEFLKKF
jgi:hypothetical protein